MNRKKIASIIILIPVVLLATWAGWKIVASTFGFFIGANDSVKAASIAAFVSVFTFFAGRYFEQSREIRSNANAQKVRVYEQFFEIYFGMFSSGKPGGKKWSEGKLIQDFLAFQKELMLWGSDGVIAAYLDFKDAMTRFDQTKSIEMPVRLAQLIKSAARLLIEMRKDVGYRFTNVTPKTLARLQLADPSTDPEVKSVMDNL